MMDGFVCKQDDKFEQENKRNKSQSFDQRDRNLKSAKQNQQDKKRCYSGGDSHVLYIVFCALGCFAFLFLFNLPLVFVVYFQAKQPFLFRQFAETVCIKIVFGVLIECCFIIFPGEIKAVEH